jgi:hypothetical protein
MLQYSVEHCCLVIEPKRLVGGPWQGHLGSACLAIPFGGQADLFLPPGLTAYSLVKP